MVKQKQRLITKKELESLVDNYNNKLFNLKNFLDDNLLEESKQKINGLVVLQAVQNNKFEKEIKDHDDNITEVLNDKVIRVEFPDKNLKYTFINETYCYKKRIELVDTLFNVLKFHGVKLHFNLDKTFNKEFEDLKCDPSVLRDINNRQAIEFYIKNNCEHDYNKRGFSFITFLMKKQKIHNFLEGCELKRPMPTKKDLSFMSRGNKFKLTPEMYFLFRYVDYNIKKDVLLEEQKIVEWHIMIFNKIKQIKKKDFLNWVYGA